MKEILLEVARSAVWDSFYAASKRLNSVQGVGSGALGLTPDSVKQTKEYALAKSEYEKCRATLRAFNKKFPAINVRQRNATSDNG